MFYHQVRHKYDMNSQLGDRGMGRGDGEFRSSLRVLDTIHTAVRCLFCSHEEIKTVQTTEGTHISERHVGTQEGAISETEGKYQAVESAGGIQSL